MKQIIKGCWQLAAGHNPNSENTESAIQDLFAFADAGITTFDCADIYTGVEELLGLFRKEYGAQRGADKLDNIRIHTKFVPDLDQLVNVDRQYVERIIDRSLSRLGVEAIDLVQFHWWDFAIPGYVETAKVLSDLVRSGKIRSLGVTNFDVPHLRELLEAGIQIASNQVQYSILDRRPEHEMIPFCKSRNISLLSYGSMAGGFLSEQYLHAPEPMEPMVNRSLTKYKLIINECGGWDVFQRTLAILAKIAEKNGVKIATLALHFSLSNLGIGGVIIGSRARHLPDIVAASHLSLDQKDREMLDGALALLRPLPGDIYSLERVKSSPHAAIIKYNLNK